MTERDLLHVACANCFGVAGRLVSRTDHFLYIRCDDCGDLSVLRDRRTPWVPGDSLHRRSTDAAAPESQPRQRPG